MQVDRDGLDARARRETASPAMRWTFLRDVGRRLVSTREGVLLLMLVALVLLFSVLSPVFLTTRNIANLLSQISMTAIAACAMTALITAGEVDLSIGSLQAFVGVVTMLALNASHSLPIGILAALGAGAAVGLLNGALVLNLNVSSFIVTLAMMFVLRGAAFMVSGASVQNTHQVAAFGQIGNGFAGPVPLPVAIAVIASIAFYAILGHTVFGRHVYATGGNRRTARMAGVRVSRVKLLCFVLMSTMAALSALILVSRMNSGEPKVGQGFEFQVLAAVLVGRSASNGGAGSLTGTLCAVLLLSVLTNGLILVNVNSSWQMAALGALILSATWLEARQGREGREGLI